MNYFKFSIPFFLILILSVPTFSQANSTGVTSGLDTYLDVLHLRNNFNGEVLVWENGQVIYNKAIGKTSLEHDLNMEKGATYRIASITKTFTGTLIAIAHQEGKLNVNEKAASYLTNLSPNFKDITIYQLLTHTSGLPHNEAIEDYWEVTSKLQMTTPQTLEEINALDLLFEPGSEMSYSTPGYYLLATILETVYDDSYENILKRKVLEPLKLTNTGTSSTFNVIPRLASGYHLISDDHLVVAPYRNYSMLKGAGDLYSNASDLLAWSTSFFDNSLMGEETRMLVFQQGSKNEEYVYGWHTEPGETKNYYHGGGTWGYSSFLALYPDDHKVIIILSNISSLPVKSIASDIEKIIFNRPFEMPEIHEQISSETIQTERYVGTYVSESGTMSLVIREQSERLFARLGKNPPFEIYPKSDHQFFGKKVDVEFTFKVMDNQVTGVTAEGMGRSFQFKKEAK